MHLQCRTTSGKSTLRAMLAVHNCCLRDDLDALLPRGRIRYVLVAVPPRTRPGVRGARAALIEASPLLDFATIKVRPDRLRAPFGRALQHQRIPANTRSVRGMSASVVIADEFAHFSDTAGPASDKRMSAAL